MTTELSDEPSGDGVAEDDDHTLREIDWREAPSVICEAVIGQANAGGVHRFVMAEIAVNPTPGAKLPKLRTTINMVVPHVALPGIIAALQDALDSVEVRRQSDEK